MEKNIKWEMYDTIDDSLLYMEMLIQPNVLI